jgi:tetratricopeptide (TPR) repeat protein/tRNA A-37 threonylcarbamoyl transferase component Bud32
VSDLQQQLAAAVGGTYRIERELGGGGMSRVFLAEETALARRVVIKVLPPEMAAGVNRDRFHREIQLAAKLQHPHVVPLLTAGAAGDLLYYVMPFIDGESLRARLARQRELPIPEAVRILREVVDALAYAHRNGVVHRDIKPDNVLLSEGHALVADFGVAKAVTASSGASSLTSLGMALGTPAYMAPEQAAADPHVDHRADIYAVGALAYEMLCGRPPFTAPTPQAVMAAHVTQMPEPVALHRPAVSEPLNGLVMRCLAKKAADRWQSAGELMPLLEALVTPSGGSTPTGARGFPAEAHFAAARRAHPARVAALFAVGGLAVLAVIYGLIRALGLPDWVFPGAIALLVVGLPIMLLTGHHERQRALLRTQGIPVTTPTVGLERHFTWRRALWGGGLAFGSLAVAAAGYTAMRILGVGPVGTLVATGVLKDRDPIIVAEFDNRTSDSTLAPSITEALRIDLGQSPVVRLTEPATIASALARMQRPAGTRLDFPVAREIAEREGIKAIVAGEVAPLGSGFVLLARLVSATDGSTLVPVRETATDAAGIIGAVDRLSRQLRERIGESLRTIRGSERLDRVTTGSLDALRAYTRGLAAHNTGQFDRAIALYQDAIGFDSTFAMAYRKMAVALSNLGADPSRTTDAATRAFELRDRLPPTERYLAMAYYYWEVEYDVSKTVEAYRSLLDLEPDNPTALNNLSMPLMALHQYAEAERVLRHAIAASDSGVWQHFNNLAEAQVALGNFAAADSAIAAMVQRQPNNPASRMSQVFLAFAEGDYDRSRAYVDTMEALTTGSVLWARSTAFFRIMDAAVHGRMAAATTVAKRAEQAAGQRGDDATALTFALVPASIDLQYRGDPTAALAVVQGALARYPLARMASPDRPYTDLAALYARAHRADLTTAVRRAWEEAAPEGRRHGPEHHVMDGHGAFARGNYAAAAAAWRAFNGAAGCVVCGLYDLGRAYDAAGQTDSAIAVLQRAVSAPDLNRINDDQGELAPTLRRLGELYEQRGARRQALDAYGRFVELWKDADPEFQPVVADVRRRIERLTAERAPS